MKTDIYQRKPFRIEAVEITESNIDEIAEKIGRISHKDDGTKFITIDPKIIPKVRRAYLGFWLTVVGDFYRCYSAARFHQRFEKVEDQLNLFDDTTGETVVNAGIDAQE